MNSLPWRQAMAEIDWRCAASLYPGDARALASDVAAILAQRLNGREEAHEGHVHSVEVRLFFEPVGALQKRSALI
jgi:hypothetical protein